MRARTQYEKGVKEEMQIRIITDLLASEQLQTALVNELGRGGSESAEGIVFDLRTTADPSRGIDATVLVALVGAGSAAFGALLAGIANVMVARQGRKVVINGSQGRRLELTGQFTKQEIDQFIQQAREIDAEQIIIK